MSASASTPEQPPAADTEAAQGLLSPQATQLITQVWTGGQLGHATTLPTTAAQAHVVPAHQPTRAGWRARLARTPRWQISPDRLVVQRYALVPSAARARFLVPLLTRPAALASLLRYNRLRDLRTATARAGIAAASATGLIDTACDQLVVTVPSDLPAQHYEQHLLLAHLREQLRTPELAAGIGVRPIDPNSKPTLQLFTGTGKPIGYAKLGWNEATRELVRNEAHTLHNLPTDMAHVHTPQVLWAGTWQGREVTVTCALPPGISRHPNPDKPPAATTLLDFAGTPHTVALTASDYWKQLTEEVPAIHADEADLGNALSRYLMAVRDHWGDTQITVARWHGDWVPWNMGTKHDRLYVWDWEHSHAQVPLGFDLAHWWFQVAFVLRNSHLVPALAHVRSRCSTGWPELGITPEQGMLVADLYLAELARRTSRLHRGGGGWNPGLYPALLAALSAQAADQADGDPTLPNPDPDPAGDPA